MKITHPVTRAAFGVIALVAIAILANWLVSLTPIGNRGIDFTENQVHTLSDGTRAILSELDTPVVIRYYATRNSNIMPEQVKLHMRRVDDLVKEYASLSNNGNLRVENLDPEPDTDAEDSANLDGLTGQRMQDQNLYFGMAVSCLDRTAVIPFIDPRDETMLEYHISKAIADVSTPSKPRIGIMSALNLRGEPAMMPGQRGTPPWMFYQQLKQSYDVLDIAMEAATIDPKIIKVLFVFHPADITPDVEYSIDQYLLGGGTVVACLDAFSMAAQQSGGGNPMMGQQGTSPTSNLPTLLPAWGVTFESTRVLADPSLATEVAKDERSICVLTVPQSLMPQKNSVITKDLEAAIFYIPGAFTRTGGGGVSANALIKSSTGAGLVDPGKAARMDPTLATSFRSSGTTYDLVTLLSGTFKTAFPDGKPKSEDAPPEEPKNESKDEKKADDKPASLKESTTPGNVFLIADVDAFYDPIAYNVQNIGGMTMATPRANASLLFNLLDQAVGSKHLIGSRSRAAVRRPFTVIQKMEDDFNQKTGVKIAEFEEKQRATIDKLNALQATRANSKDPYLSPEQEQEIHKLRREQVNYAKLIREEQKGLRRQKDDLTAKITLLNVCGMPLIVMLAGVGLFAQRRRSTRAR